MTVALRKASHTLVIAAQLYKELAISAAMLFAIALAARTWVESQGPAARAARLHKETMDAWKALPGNHEKPDDTSDAEEVIANQANRVS